MDHRNRLKRNASYDFKNLKLKKTAILNKRRPSFDRQWSSKSASDA